MNRQTKDLQWDGRIKWWSALNESGSLRGDSNLSMCAQDAGTTIWSWFEHPNTLDSTKQGNVWLDDCSPELEQMLASSISHTGYKQFIQEAMARHLQMVAQHIVLDGFIKYNINAGWTRGKETRKLEDVRLNFVPRGSVISVPKFAFQVIPPTERDHHGGQRVVRLDPERLITFQAPRRWQQPLRRIRHTLRAIGKSEHLWMMTSARDEVQEEFASVARSYAVQSARAVAPIGWTARGLYRDYIADYHMVSRELHWYRFCIELRDEILTRTADVFKLIGSLCGERPTLRWDRLPTVEMVVEIERRLIAGDLNFDEALKPFECVA